MFGVLGAVVAAAVAQTLPSGSSEQTVTFGSRKSTVVIHNYPKSESEPAPIVLALHGWFQSATGSHSICNTGKIKEHAQKLGFIGACPDGNGAGNSAKSWNAAGCCGKAAAQGVDDVGFIREVIKYIKERASVSKVYAIGLSNGGMLSWRLMCEASDVIHGVAPVAGGYFGAPPPFFVKSTVRVPNGWLTTTQDCSEANYPPTEAGKKSTKCWTANSFTCKVPAEGFPLLHIHGDKDTEEPFAMVVQQWHFYGRMVLGCRGDRLVKTIGNARCVEFEDCKHKTALCEVSGLGHAMPGPGVGFDAVEAAWEYWHGGFTFRNRTAA